MEPTSRGEGWLIAVLVGMQVLALAGSADSEEQFRAGMKDFTVSAGYWVDHNTGDLRDTKTVDGFQFIPHFGYFLTDTHGTG